MDNKLMFKFMKIYYIYTIIKYMFRHLYTYIEKNIWTNKNLAIKIKLLNRIFFLLDNEGLNNFLNTNDLYTFRSPSYKCLD